MFVNVHVGKYSPHNHQFPSDYVCLLLNVVLRFLTYLNIISPAISKGLLPALVI